MENTSFTSLGVLIIFKCSNCEQKHQGTLCIQDTSQGTYGMDYISYQQFTWKFSTVKKKRQNKTKTHMKTHILHHPHLQIWAAIITASLWWLLWAIKLLYSSEQLCSIGSNWIISTMTTHYFNNLHFFTKSRVSWTGGNLTSMYNSESNRKFKTMMGRRIMSQ